MSHHLALLVPDLRVGGAQRVMLYLAGRFAAAGHRVDVLAFHDGPLVAEVPDSVRWVPLKTAGGVQSVRHLARWLDAERPAALLSSVTGANLVAVAARALCRHRPHLVLREAVTLANVRSPLRLAAMRLLYPRADAVVALSPVMATEIQKRLGVARERIHYLPNPVDAARLAQQAREPLDHPFAAEADRLLVTAGRLIPQKDHATLLEAFARIDPRLGARLAILGDGPERSRLEARAAALGITANVCFAGFEANPWRWIRRARGFVLSSRWEGHPNALIEALALGRPAVCTGYDASAECLGSDGRVRVVPVADPKALAEAMVALLKTPPSPPTLAPPGDDSVSGYLHLLCTARPLPTRSP
ncbi:MAG: glycosyltransferase [Rhodocyclaceae bacterium]|nr:glycosyltransferase [Rhodocyclaceae bacterium]